MLTGNWRLCRAALRVGDVACEHTFRRLEWHTSEYLRDKILPYELKLTVTLGLDRHLDPAKSLKLLDVTFGIRSAYPLVVR